MFADTSKPPQPLPTSELQKVQPGISLLAPLSRRGHGPGLIVLTAASKDQMSIVEGVPSPLIKWAEEGYTVAQVDASAFERLSGDEIVNAALLALEVCDRCEPKGKVGLVAYDPQLWNKIAPALADVEVVAAAVYANTSDVSKITTSGMPTLCHIAGKGSPAATKTGTLTEYCYPKTHGHAFATPFHDHFSYAAESVAHTRNLQHLKPHMQGPYFDLEQIWEEHTYYEFADRSVEHTMGTMVQEPYVNHVPTLMGGIGRTNLTNFYRDHFIFQNPPDTDTELVSRTVGIDRVIDEFIFKFTHTCEIDWLLPGVPPMHLKAEVPFTSVVNIRGDRLYHEHIAWDQGTLLRQLGLMPECLPFPGSKTSDAPTQYRVPVAGAETAGKMRDRASVASNGLMRSEDPR